MQWKLGNFKYRRSDVEGMVATYVSKSTLLITALPQEVEDESGKLVLRIGLFLMGSMKTYLWNMQPIFNNP